MSERPRVLIELGAELDRAARGRRRRASRLRHLPVPSLSGVGALLAVGCALAVAAVAIVALGHGRPSSTTGAVAPPAHRNPDHLRAWFAALRRPPRPADRLPSQVSAELTQHPLVAGMALRSSRRVISTRDLQVWLVLERRGLCDVDVNSGPRVPARIGFGAGCIGIAGAEKYGLLSAGRKMFQAILPDGTSNVTITFIDGSSTVLAPNADGVILYNTTHRIGRFSFTSPAGARVSQKVIVTHPPRP